MTDGPITQAEVLALAGSFERSAAWLLAGELQKPQKDFPLVGVADYQRAATMLLRLHNEAQALTAQRDVAMHDIQALQAELEARQSAPFPAHGQCETCGVFSDSAKALHDARRNCGT